MNNALEKDTSQYVTTVGLTGAEIFKVFGPLPHLDGLTFDGAAYTEALAAKVFLSFRSGYGDFFPTPGIVPGHFVWVGKEFESESGNILESDDDLIWINFQSQAQGAGK